jgi:hypothetical protein
MRSTLCLSVLVIAFVVAVGSQAAFAQWRESPWGSVTQLRAYPFGAHMHFWLSNGAGSTSCGDAHFRFDSQQPNGKVIYGTLLSSLLSGKEVFVYYECDGIVNNVLEIGIRQ